MAITEQERREQKRQDDLAKLRGLRPMDDNFMRCIFKDNKPLAHLVLRIILDKQDLIVEDVKTQEDMKRLVGARSLALDVYATDSEKKKYDVEIQRADKDADKKRARYHSSVIDVDNLNAGDEFSKLPNVYVIFITENDQFGDDKPFHRIERVDLDSKDQSLWDDGEHILYVNGAYRGESEIGRLMHDFNCWDPSDMYFKEMQEITRYYKETEEGVEFMCKAFEETRLEGERYGEHRGKVNTAKRMLLRGKMTLEEIAEDAELPLEEVQELARKMTVAV